MNHNGKKVMLLIDGDNVSADVVEKALARVDAKHGAVHVRRAYCTAEAAVNNQALYKRLGIRPQVNLATGKNSTDIALAVDAIDLAIAERPDVVVIVSSDSDFAPLVTRLREKGCRVEGLGQRGKTGDETKPIYDDFEDIEHGKGRPAAVKAPAKKRAPRPPAAPKRPALPQDVQDILDALPDLRGGLWIRLNAAAEPLRKAKLLGKTAASTKLFKKHSAHFALRPEAQPSEVRFLGVEG
jgi:uncharacterized protein (TIGR00288 family)